LTDLIDLVVLLKAFIKKTIYFNEISFYLYNFML